MASMLLLSEPALVACCSVRQKQAFREHRTSVRLLPHGLVQCKVNHRCKAAGKRSRAEYRVEGIRGKGQSRPRRPPRRQARPGSRSGRFRSEEHTSELQSLMRTSYAVFCLKKK